MARNQADGPLLIFDCDGVLVDSELLSLQVLLAAMARAGLTMTAAEAQARFLGRSMAATCDILSERYGVDLANDRLREMRESLYELFRKELRPIPHVKEAIKRVAVPRCVASSSQLERIRLSLHVTGLLDLFEPNIYSASMVRDGKPAPDLFLFAAERMKASASRCVVIEDSPAGIEAGRRAGMTVFAFTGGSHAGAAAHRAAIRQAGPDAVFADMAELPALVRRHRGAMEQET
ncbi:MAG: HAD family hydrolase [Azospirillaceae bacterium]